MPFTRWSGKFEKTKSNAVKRIANIISWAHIEDLSAHCYKKIYIKTKKKWRKEKKKKTWEKQQINNNNNNKPQNKKTKTKNYKQKQKEEKKKPILP